MNKTYLGDGVYIELRAFDFVLTTLENGISTTNTIVLEPRIMSELINWVKRIETNSENPHANT